MADKMDKKYIKVIICLCGLIAGSVGILNNCFGIFYKTVSSAIGVSQGNFVLTNTISVFILSSISIFTTRKINEKNFKPVVICGVVICGITIILMGFSSKLWHFYLLGIIRGIAASTFGIAMISTIINNWFKKSNGTITSLILAFSGIAGAVFSPIINMINVNFGWRNGYISLGIFMILLGVPFMLSNFTLRPENSGMSAYGQLSEVKIIQADQSPVKIDLSIILLIIFVIFSYFAVGSVQYLPSFASDRGLSVTVTGLIVSFNMIGNILFKFAIGTLADRIGMIKASIMMILINITGTVLLLNTTNSILVLTASFLIGAIYSLTAVGGVLVTRYVVGPANYSKVYPTVSLIGSLFFSIGGTFVGFLYDGIGSYTIGFSVCAILIGLNIAVLLILSKVKKEETE